MPEVRVRGRALPVEAGKCLLDVLQGAGLPVTSSCRAGHCQTCLVRSDSCAIPASARHGLGAAQRKQGWLLSCQCPVQGDLDIQLLDPARDGTPATVHSLDWLTPSLVRLRLVPQRAVRFAPGQHVTLWLDDRLARPYSIASLSGDPWLEFHVRVHSQGIFSREISRVDVGRIIHLGIPTGHIRFDTQWLEHPLLLLSRGSGLAPIQAVAREALNQGHAPGITLWHWHSDTDDGCYLGEALLELQQAHPSLTLHLHHAKQLAADLQRLHIASRRTVALAAGSPTFVEQLRRPLFMAGLPGRQIIDEAFATGRA
ncbi:2Fe-2S iron-sulfur cluster binding domain-containing protein [Halopseudomonas nanhaiensis]|uniref:2Fe-2S iron-sulfur cluster-binding protein n=1 Tax=Halopseudomonas nanhaiensis TaxID=2830842 RepID=UPI001CBC676F|nr:2Fe-2S iron-sulfur cluster-binding protein [Halopseudomonas nanhaiensis]UAW99310.1 2Fe-2S iron-sulfur cluster binding domain-containing protein [Halopseudomonas nanhaiensis]